MVVQMYVTCTFRFDNKSVACCIFINKSNNAVAKIVADIIANYC